MDVDGDIDGDDIIVHPDDPVPWFPEQATDEKPLRLKRRRKCGQCGPCQIKTNCGECPYCVRRSVLKQSCIYRKCIYLRKPLTKRSPSADEPPVRKRRRSSRFHTSKSYPPTLLTPDAEERSPYELLSPSEQDAYLEEFLSPPDDGNHGPDFTSPPHDGEFRTEVRLEQHGGIIFPEFVISRSIAANPTENETKESGQDTSEQIVPIVQQEVNNRSKSEVKVMPDPSKSSRVIRTPPHPLEHDDEDSEAVNPQMLKALKTVKECGHNFIQTEKPVADNLANNVDDIHGRFSLTLDLTTKPSRDETENQDTNVKNCEDIPKKAPTLSSKGVSFTSWAELRRNHAFLSLYSSYGGRNPFFSPPNVTVNRYGGFSQTEGIRKKSNVWPEPCESSLPLNLSQNQSSSPPPPKNPADLSKHPPWSLGTPPYGISPMARMPFPPGAYPHPYPAPGLEYPSITPLHPHPAFSNFHHPYFPPRMQSIHPFPPPGSLFHPDRPPYPTGLFPAGLSPHTRLPYPHQMYPGAYLTQKPEDYSLTSLNSKPTLEKDGPESSENEEDNYKKFSIFRLKDKSSLRDKSSPRDKVEKFQNKIPACNNDTLRSLLNQTTPNTRNIETNSFDTENSKSNSLDAKISNNPLDVRNRHNNSLDSKNSYSLNAKNGASISLDAINSNSSYGTERNSMQKIHIDLSKAMYRSDIDEDLRKEMHKVSGYCGCNFITIDDLKMQALIRSDGVNNLEIEIPSPDATLRDPIPLSKSKTPPVSKETQSSPKQNIASCPVEVPVQGMVSLKQDLGEAGVVILEVNSDKVQLVQCELSEDILKHFKDPIQVKEFVTKSRNSFVCEENFLEEKTIRDTSENKTDLIKDNESGLLKPSALKKGVYHFTQDSSCDDDSNPSLQSAIGKLSEFVKSKIMEKERRKQLTFDLDCVEDRNKKDCDSGDQLSLSGNDDASSCIVNTEIDSSANNGDNCDRNNDASSCIANTGTDSSANNGDDCEVSVDTDLKRLAEGDKQSAVNDSLYTQEVREGISPLNLVSSPDNKQSTANEPEVCDSISPLNLVSNPDKSNESASVNVMETVIVDDTPDNDVIDLTSSGADSIHIISIDDEEEEKKEDGLSWNDSTSVDNSAKIVIEDVQHVDESDEEWYRIEINDDFDTDEKALSPPICIE